MFPFPSDTFAETSIFSLLGTKFNAITDGPENFNVYVKIGDMTICQRTFNAKHYPPKIRYTVDLRPQLKSVLNDLTDIFSGKNFNYYYPNFNQNQ